MRKQTNSQVALSAQQSANNSFFLTMINNQTCIAPTPTIFTLISPPTNRTHITLCVRHCLKLVKGYSKSIFQFRIKGFRCLATPPLFAQIFIVSCPTVTADSFTILPIPSRCLSLHPLCVLSIISKTVFMYLRAIFFDVALHIGEFLKTMFTVPSNAGCHIQAFSSMIGSPKHAIY
jgi:hypothetical protein